jgi:hypothetical protein
MVLCPSDLLSNGNRVLFPLKQYGWRVKLTTHLRLETMPRIQEIYLHFQSLLHVEVIRCVQGQLYLASIQNGITLWRGDIWVCRSSQLKMEGPVYWDTDRVFMAQSLHEGRRCFRNFTIMNPLNFMDGRTQLKGSFSIKITTAVPS